MQNRGDVYLSFNYFYFISFVYSFFDEASRQKMDALLFIYLCFLGMILGRDYICGCIYLFIDTEHSEKRAFRPTTPRNQTQ